MEGRRQGGAEGGPGPQQPDNTLSLGSSEIDMLLYIIADQVPNDGASGARLPVTII
jgi:hypothetical protein